MRTMTLNKFTELFGNDGDIRAYFSPGRVNLIGEHTDYNGGHVFPCALTIGTYGVARKRNDRTLRFYSLNFERLGVIVSSLNDLVPDPAADWTNYPKGVMWAFEKRGLKMDAGLDIVICGNIVMKMSCKVSCTAFFCYNVSNTRETENRNGISFTGDRQQHPGFSVHAFQRKTY